MILLSHIYLFLLSLLLLHINFLFNLNWLFLPMHKIFELLFSSNYSFPFNIDTISHSLILFSTPFKINLPPPIFRRNLHQRQTILQLTSLIPTNQFSHCIKRDIGTVFDLSNIWIIGLAHGVEFKMMFRLSHSVKVRTNAFPEWVVHVHWVHWNLLSVSLPIVLGHSNCKGKVIIIFVGFWFLIL